MNKLNKLYEAMLKSWGVSFTEDYALMLNMGGVEVPVKVDDKQTYLPTSENLNGMTIGKVFFHPACESIMSKETEIFKVIRKLTAAKIYSTFQPIFDVIVSVAGKKSGKTLNGKMLEQLEPFKSVTKAVRQEVVEIIKMISITLEDQSIDTRLINFSLIKGGKTDNDETAYYTATPSFPFYTELYRTVSQNEHMKHSDRLTFNGVNVSMQALQIVIALFELAMPAVIDPSRKKYSATSPDAARLIAYLHSYALVASDLNSLIGKFRKEFDSIGIYGIDLEWLEELDGIGEIKKLIPALEYNNYNITSSPETPASNGGQRIQSYNPLAGVINTTSGNQAVQNAGQVPSSAPRAPDANPGETYQGCEYSPNNGIYEYKYLNPNGMVRVRRLAEDGRFISEDFQNPAAQMGMVNINGMMLPANMVMPGMMVQPQQIGSGIPMFGIGNNNMTPNGYVRDPYNGQLVPATGNANVNNNWNNNSNTTVMGNGLTSGYTDLNGY